MKWNKGIGPKKEKSEKKRWMTTKQEGRNEREMSKYVRSTINNFN